MGGHAELALSTWGFCLYLQRIPHESPYSPVIASKGVLESQDKSPKKLARGYVAKV